ncbi:MAG: protein kinase, partial [bacterium]|nr:protein kinase [bacterium]
EKGISHRDPRPANSKGSDDGQVKVLDFGLAKALEGDPASVSAEQSPTLTIGATKAGVILGTAAYMSPEQARAKPVDKRADIWAFGVVLYEMLTGRELFGGETVSDSLAAVITKDPDWDPLPDATSGGIRRLLARCLRKDRKSRLQAIGEARITLEEVLSGDAEDQDLTAALASGPSRSWAGWLGWVAAALFAAAIPAAWVLRSPPPQGVIRFAVDPPEGTQTPAMASASAPISPDGRTLAFVAVSADGKLRLWVRPLDRVEAEVLPGTEDASYPFWSPDSRALAFFAGGKLYSVDIAGGQPRIISDAPQGWGGDWNADGVIVFGSQGHDIQRVSARGGRPEVVVPMDTAREEASQRDPSFLPDGRRFLYHSIAAEQRGIWVGSLDGDPPRFLFLQYYSPARYAPGHSGGRGHLLFAQDGRLVAQPFDPDRADLEGEAWVVAEPLRRGPSFWTSANGVLAYRGAEAGNIQLTWFDRQGKQAGKVGEPGPVYHPTLSPDQRSIAYQLQDAGYNSDIWLMDLERATTTRHTFGQGDETAPLWTR